MRVRAQIILHWDELAMASIHLERQIVFGERARPSSQDHVERVFHAWCVAAALVGIEVGPRGLQHVLAKTRRTAPVAHRSLLPARRAIRDVHVCNWAALVGEYGVKVGVFGDVQRKRSQPKASAGENRRRRVLVSRRKHRARVVWHFTVTMIRNNNDESIGEGAPLLKSLSELRELLVDLAGN